MTEIRVKGQTEVRGHSLGETDEVLVVCVDVGELDVDQQHHLKHKPIVFK